MRTHLFLAGLISASLCSSAALGEESSALDLNSHSLKAKDALVAWAELESSSRPPPSPKEWSDTPPTPKEKEKFYTPFVEALADRFKDFYSRFPHDSNAADAKLGEFKYVMLTLSWGDTKQQNRLDNIEQALLKDPAISKDQHYMILWTMANNSPPDKARPLLQEIANGADAPDKMKDAAAGQLKSMALVGQQIDLAFTALDGRNVDMSKLKGKVVLVDFWATWCPPCRGEVPNVKKTYDKYHSQGFEILGISLDKDKDSLTQFVAENKMDWPQFFDGQYWQNKYAKQFGIESIPTMWLIDKKGKLRDMNAREDLAGGVQKLLAE